MKKGKESAPAMKKGKESASAPAMKGKESARAMKKGKELADAAAMGRDVVASRSRGSYDVILTCLGFDTHHTIADDLFRSLGQARIGVFRDYNERGDGDEIDRKFLRAIDRAKIYIPIFSVNSACRVRCLKRIAAMVERKAKSGGGKTILPIFYDVKPRDVRLKTPLYCDNLEMHARRFGSKEIEAWETALKEVGSLPGWKTGDGRETRELTNKWRT